MARLRLLGQIWRSDVVGHVEVNALAVCGLVEAGLLQLQRGGAKRMDSDSLMSGSQVVHVLLGDFGRVAAARYAPFEDEPAEGFVGPRRGAQRSLEKLHFLLKTLWTDVQESQPLISQVLIINAYLVDLPYGDLLVGAD